MLDYWFKIKVSDLLKTPWTHDTISFENKISSQIEWLQKNWVKWSVFIQSLDYETLYVRLENISAEVEDICDICWKNYIIDINIESFETKFIAPEKHKNIKEEIHDEEFLISMKDESIDIEDLVAQSIILERSVINRCEKCINIIPDEKSEEIEEFESLNTIKWIK